jgi:hypothetical protein
MAGGLPSSSVGYSLISISLTSFSAGNSTGGLDLLPARLRLKPVLLLLRRQKKSAAARIMKNARTPLTIPAISPPESLVFGTDVGVRLVDEAVLEVSVAVELEVVQQMLLKLR